MLLLRSIQNLTELTLRKTQMTARKLIGTSSASRAGHQWRRNQRAVTQLSLVVVSYLIGYLPLIVYFLNTSHDDKSAAKQRTDYWVSVFDVILIYYVRSTFSSLLMPKNMSPV